MCRAIQIMQEGKKKAEAETRQMRADKKSSRAEDQMHQFVSRASLSRYL